MTDIIINNIVLASLVSDGSVDADTAIMGDSSPEATQAIMEAASVRDSNANGVFYEASYIAANAKRLHQTNLHQKSRSHALFKPKAAPLKIALKSLDEVVRVKDEPTLYYEDMPIVKALANIRPFKVKNSDDKVVADEDQEGPFSSDLLRDDPSNETRGADYQVAKRSVAKHKAVANEKVEARVEKPLVLKEMTHHFAESTLRSDVKYGVIKPRKMHIPLAGGTSWQPDPIVEKSRRDQTDCYLFGGSARECSRTPTVVRDIPNKLPTKEAGKL